MPVLPCLHNTNHAVVKVLHRFVGLLCTAALAAAKNLGQLGSLVNLKQNLEEPLRHIDVVPVEPRLSERSEALVLAAGQLRKHLRLRLLQKRQELPPQITEIPTHHPSLLLTQFLLRTLRPLQQVAVDCRIDCGLKFAVRLRLLCHDAAEGRAVGMFAEEAESP